MKTKIVFTSLLFGLLALHVSAQRGIRTLKDENLKIRHGMKNGSLTRQEVRQLKMQETKLKLEKRRFLANDGKLGRREKAKLIRDEKRFDRNIRRQKHDRQRRH